MKIQTNKATRIIILLIPTLLFLFVATPTLAAPSRVAILPFDMHAEKDLAFLQEGILDMLGSRLAWKDKVEVINENETKTVFESIEGFDGESRALLAGGKLKADYVLFGSLTVFGESVSIDAKMVDVSGQQEPLPFFAQTRGMGEVIPKINEFATNINATVFGRQVARRPVAAPTIQAGAAPAQQSLQQPAQQPYDPRMHPEKLLQSGVQSENQVPIAGQQSQTPNPGFIVASPSGRLGNGPTFWKSRNFKMLLTGLAIGDVDNDGALETVMIADGKVMIYRNQKNRLAKLNVVENTRSGHYVGVDVADINGNGTPEIFVSSMSLARDRFNSFVLEYNGTTFATIVDNSPWHYRIVGSAVGSDMLLGQRRPNDEGDLFSTPIYRMNWQADDYVNGAAIIRGRRANVIGVAYDDVMADGLNRVVVYSPGDRIRIYDPNSEEAWAGSQRMGGNMYAFNIPTKDPSESENIQYFPMRLRTADIDQDGKVEVIAAANRDLLSGTLQKFRAFQKSELISFSWNGLGLVPNWKTSEISGRISDFFVGDFDNDGADELVLSVVLKEGGIAFTEAKSTIIAYDLAASGP